MNPLNFEYSVDNCQFKLYKALLGCKNDDHFE